MSAATSAEEKVRVLIVGGGGAGLTASMLLARQGVDHLLVSARPGTSDLPKAHVLNQRAMEVLEDVGVAQAIAARSTPAEHMRATAFYAGFAGPDSDYGRRLARLESWGAGGADDGWRAASPWRQLNLPQIRLEPLLKARAEELSPGGSASIMSWSTCSRTATGCAPPSATTAPAAITWCTATTCSARTEDGGSPVSSAWSTRGLA